MVMVVSIVEQTFEYHPLKDFLVVFFRKALSSAKRRPHFIPFELSFNGSDNKVALFFEFFLECVYIM